MKKYLLLRDNTVSGPYSILVITGMNLKARDLVWIEGESTCWLPASQMEELKSSVEFEDEDDVLKRRDERIKSKKPSIVSPDSLPPGRVSTFKKGNGRASYFQRDTDATYKYIAPHFKERKVSPTTKKEIWQRRVYPVANLLNVTIVFLTVSFGAFIIKQVVEGFENNIIMVSGKESPVKKTNTVQLNADTKKVDANTEILKY